jgi:hypothetical protein
MYLELTNKYNSFINFQKKTVGLKKPTVFFIEKIMTVTELLLFQNLIETYF